jgi:hypothetical protein
MLNLKMNHGSLDLLNIWKNSSNFQYHRIRKKRKKERKKKKREAMGPDHVT